MPSVQIRTMSTGEVVSECNNSSSTASAQTKLFAELNLGQDVTKGLRKVTSDMQTHKNPALRSQFGPLKFSTGRTSESTRSAVAVDQGKSPRKQLEGKKWMVEYQKNETNLVISETGMNQVVYVYKCEGCTLQVKGEVN